MKKGNGLAVLLIAAGVLLILWKLGIFQYLMGLLFPILIIALGVIAWSHGRFIIGGIIGTIGALMLLGKLAPLLIWSAAIALIIFGFSMMFRRKSGARI